MKTKTSGHRQIIAIDAGNTRIKWGLHNGKQWSKRGWVETARAAKLEKSIGTAGKTCVAFVISNVAGATLRRAIKSALPGMAKVSWIKSAREQCGVRSSYEDPAQLGSDRWAALIAARRLFGVSSVVVNAGTALTVDALTEDGVFVGGLIVPGAELMRKALADHTDGLKLQPGGFTFFPNATGDAIMSGAVNATCGAIERVARFLEDTGQSSPLCVLSGGGAALIEQHLNLPVKVVDNLVLEGLLTIATGDRTR
jgi:type III pantothenate kinase